MPPFWTVLKILFRVVGPSIPDVVSTISAIKKHQETQTGNESLDNHLSKIEKAITHQLKLIEQLTKQLVEFRRLVRKAMILAVFAAAVAIFSLGFVLIQ